MKSKEAFNKKHGLQKESKSQLKRKIAKIVSLKSTVNMIIKRIKRFLHQGYKTYRNILSTLLKQSEKRYHNGYFKKIISIIVNTWKGIKINNFLKH